MLIKLIYVFQITLERSNKTFVILNMHYHLFLSYVNGKQF